MNVTLNGADCAEGCDQVQRLALEILGHLAAMAESMSPFQTHQVSIPLRRVIHSLSAISSFALYLDFFVVL